MVKALADRLAEAFAEYLHAQARKDWGYGEQEHLAVEDLVAEKFRGIRPAFGYPAPRSQRKFKLFEKRRTRQGITPTEHAAMLPAASVSGLYFSHPQASLLNIGRVGRDQAESAAKRKGVWIEEVERWLSRTSRMTRPAAGRRRSRTGPGRAAHRIDLPGGGPRSNVARPPRWADEPEHRRPSGRETGDHPSASLRPGVKLAMGCSSHPPATPTIKGRRRLIAGATMPIHVRPRWLVAAVCAMGCTAVAALPPGRRRRAGASARVQLDGDEARLPRSVRLSGTVEAVEATTISTPRLAGQNNQSLVITRLVRPGSMVLQGDLIVNSTGRTS
jgi:hypothetical protein